MTYVPFPRLTLSDGELGVEKDAIEDDVKGVRGSGCKVGVGSGDQSFKLVDEPGDIDGRGDGSTIIGGDSIKNESLITHRTSTECLCQKDRRTSVHTYISKFENQTIDVRAHPVQNRAQKSQSSEVRGIPNVLCE